MKTLLTSLFLLISIAGYTCSCWGPADFCSVVSDTASVDDFVIMGKKIRDIEHGMEVEVIKTYRGEIEAQSVYIWGDLGWLCREYTSRFVVGETYIFDLYQIGNGSVHPFEASTDFALSFCGLHYLSVKDGNVIGFISHSDAVQKVAIETFDSYFENNDCSSIKSDVIEIDAIVSPNPFMEEILIRSNQRIMELELYDMTGKLILTRETDRFYYRLDLSDFKFTSGMYILRIIGFQSEEKLIKIIKI